MSDTPELALLAAINVLRVNDVELELRIYRRGPLSTGRISSRHVRSSIRRQPGAQPTEAEAYLVDENGRSVRDGCKADGTWKRVRVPTACCMN